MKKLVSLSARHQHNFLFLGSIIVFIVLWVPSDQIGYAVVPNQEQHGDAPNSSVCRAALKNASSLEAKCEVTRTLRGCQFDSGFLPYLQFEYCVFGEQIVPTVFLILWLVVLLGAFATIADSFFSPSLIALARTLHMGENLAGVTLLAFGNGAPDVFSAVTAITTGDPDAPDEGLGLGFLLGSGLLVNTVTAGLVMASTPFKMSRRPFLKDTFFYLCAVGWSATMLIRRQLYFADAIGFLVFYCVYVLVTWLGATVHRRQIQAEKRNGIGTFWPAPIQRLLDFLSRVWLRIKTHFTQCSSKLSIFFCACFKLKRKKIDKSNSSVQETVKNGTNAPTILTNGSIYYGNGGVVDQYGSKLAQTTQPTQTLQKPIIEVTSVDSPEFRFDDRPHIPGTYTPSFDLSTDLSRASPLNPPENMIPMQYLQPEERQRQRSSSMGVSDEDIRGRRLSNSGTGTVGLARDRCRRSHSVSRRRPSTRMSSAGYELPYLVRWIIANREMEEKDLGTSGQKGPASDTEGGISGSVFDIASSQASKKASRRTSLVDSPLPVPSPTASMRSAEEDRHDKSTATTKKITLDLVPKEPQTMSWLSEPTSHLEEIEESIQTEEELIDDDDWLVRWASKGVWHHFAYYMIPVDTESWPRLSVVGKMCQILKVPIYVVFRLTIPTVLEELTDDNEVDAGECTRVDENVTRFGGSESKPDLEKNAETSETEPFELDLEAMHGWCKPLNVAQCIIVPTLWPLLLTMNGRSFGLSPIGNSPVPIFVPFTLVGTAIATGVYFTSKWNEPPRLYHRPFFALLGFGTSIIWIYTLAHELVNSLEALGITWEISEAILGLSVMALASSIGDIMSNCLLARNGYPRIAYAACIGSPLFNLLIGAGLSFTIKISKNNDSFAILSFTLTQAVLFSCLMAVLICNVIVALIFNFEFHRAYGIVLIILYVAFVTIAILIEMDYIVSPKNWGLLTGTE